MTATLGVCDHPIPGLTADQTLIHLKETHVLVCRCAVVIDALFQSSTEGEGRVTKTVKGAWRVLTPPILTVRGILALIDIRLLLRGHTAVAVRGQGPGQGADAVVGAWRVHTLTILTVGRVQAFIQVCCCFNDTFLLVGVRSPGQVAVAVERAVSVNAVAVGTERLIVAFIHINALEKIAVVVKALLTVALISRQCVLTAAFFTDFLGKQSALINIMIDWQAVLDSFFIIQALTTGAQGVELSGVRHRTGVDLAVVTPAHSDGAAALLFGDVCGQNTVTENGVIEVQVALLLLICHHSDGLTAVFVL